MYLFTLGLHTWGVPCIKGKTNGLSSFHVCLSAVHSYCHTQHDRPSSIAHAYSMQRIGFCANINNLSSSIITASHGLHYVRTACIMLHTFIAFINIILNEIHSLLVQLQCNYVTSLFCLHSAWRFRSVHTTVLGDVIKCYHLHVAMY